MTTSESGEADGSDPEYAVVLDYLPHGRPDDDRPQYKKPPLAYGIGESAFRLVELTLADDADVGIGDRVVIEPADDRESVERLRDIDYGDLSNSAVSELDYVVEEIVEREEQRFVDFYNDAQPITLRNNVLEERKRKPFESFAELEERVSGLHNPKDVLVDRIIEELRDDDLKYKTFVRREE
jgi:putative nucleotide binding protein